MHSVSCYHHCQTMCSWDGHTTAVMAPPFFVVTVLTSALIIHSEAASNLEHAAMANVGDDYIVQGENLKTYEDSRGAWFGGQKPLATYPWFVTLRKNLEQVIYTYKGQSSDQASNWPDLADRSDLTDKYIVYEHFCSGVLILPRVVLTADHCFWMKRENTPQYWPRSSNPGKWRLYKSSETKKKLYVSTLINH